MEFTDEDIQIISNSGLAGGINWGLFEGYDVSDEEINKNVDSNDKGTEVSRGHRRIDKSKIIKAVILILASTALLFGAVKGTQAMIERIKYVDQQDDIQNWLDENYPTILETHRTNDGQNWFYDFSETVVRAKSTDDFDSFVFSTFSSIKYKERNMGQFFSEMGLDWKEYMREVSGSTSTTYEDLEEDYKRASDSRITSVINGEEVAIRTYDDVKSAGKGGK